MAKVQIKSEKFTPSGVFFFNHRVFSLFFGLTLGFIHNYYGPILTDRMKEKDFSRLGIYFYLLVLAGLFIFLPFLPFKARL